MEFKKTYTTEISAMATCGFAIFQGYKSGEINPALIGEMVTNLYIVLPAVFCAVRLAYKKWAREVLHNAIKK